MRNFLYKIQLVSTALSNILLCLHNIFDVLYWSLFIIFCLITKAMPTIISRSEWGAKSPSGPVDPLDVNPPPYVIIHHAASDTCTTRAICQAKVRTFQVKYYFFQSLFYDYFSESINSSLI